jgi:glycosyltransferase involved in cell wall biosynthesis
MKKYLKKKQRIKPKKNFENINQSFPLVTIVTVVLNNEAFIEGTIQSVLSQTYRNIEYIIIDGGSTDGTLNIIRKYEKFISFWVSEKDKGIYDAMNKGLKLAKGRWLNFMNSGDTFYSKDTINSIPFTDFQNSPMIYGRTRLFSKNRKFLMILKPLICNKLNLILFHSSVVCHQAVFYNADIKFRYPDKYKILGDLHSYFEYIKHGTAKRLNTIIANYCEGGFSKNANSKIERLVILKEQAGVFYLLHYVFFIYLLIRKITKITAHLFLKKKNIKKIKKIIFR